MAIAPTYQSSGGNFGSQLTQQLQQGFDYLLSSDSSGSAHTFTLVARGAGGTIIRYVPTGGAIVVRGDGVNTVTIDGADAHAYWESGPIGSFRNGVGGNTAVGAVLTAPSGDQTITNGNLFVAGYLRSMNGTAISGGAQNILRGFSNDKSVISTNGAGYLAMDADNTFNGLQIPAVKSYAGLTTAGTLGLPVVVAVAQNKAETGSADATMLTYAPPAAIGTYRLDIAADVSSATSGVIGFTVSYNDSNGNATGDQGITLFRLGVAAGALTITVSVASNFRTTHFFATDNSGTNIVVKWVGGGVSAALVNATLTRVQ